MAARQRPRHRRLPPTTAPLSKPPVRRCRRSPRACRRAPGKSAAAPALACATHAPARDRVRPRPRTSIYVLLIAPGFFQIGDERNRLVGRPRTMRGDDLDPCALDILGHAFGIAADVAVRAVHEPGPEGAADLGYAVLDVELLGAVARPGERKPGQRARRLHAGELVLVEEIVIAALVAEEQPVAPGRFARHAFVQEGAKRCDAGA